MTWESSVTNTPFEREKQKHKYNKKVLDLKLKV